eukprot:1379482-Pyramimonas_sp.AAC.1
MQCNSRKSSHGASWKLIETRSVQINISREAGGISFPPEVRVQGILEHICRHGRLGKNEPLDEKLKQLVGAGALCKDADQRRHGAYELCDVLAAGVPMQMRAWESLTKPAKGVLDPALLVLPGLRPLGTNDNRTQ